MRSLRVVQVCRKPLLMNLAFTELGWRFCRFCKRVCLELGSSRSNSHHLFRICLPWLLRLCRSTFLLSENAQLLESLRLRKSESLVRCWLSSTSRNGWRIIFPHLSTCGTRSAIQVRQRSSLGDARTSFAALALSLLGTFFTL